MFQNADAFEGSTSHILPYVSWAYNQLYLPEEFHTKTGFRNFRKCLKHKPINGYEQSSMVLALGLAMRDIICGIETAPGEEPASMPAHVSASPLLMPDLESLLEIAPALEKLDKR